MTKLDLQYDLVNYTPASASPVEANFTRTEQHINQEVIERDGTVAMRSQLKLVGDPVSALDAVPKQYVDLFLPVGVIMMYGGMAAPLGGRWVLCNGAELQISEYPELFAVLGIAYGGSSGRFKVPDLVAKFPRGGTPGSTGGSADSVASHTHLLTHNHAATTTGNNSVSHTHAGADHAHGGGSYTSSWQTANHNHNINGGELWRSTASAPDNVTTFAVRVGDGITIGMEKFNSNATTTGNQNQNHDHTINQGISAGADRALTTGTQNANHTHTIDLGANTTRTDDANVAAVGGNLPPYVGVSYIIRTK